MSKARALVRACGGSGRKPAALRARLDEQLCTNDLPQGLIVDVETIIAFHVGIELRQRDLALSTEALVSIARACELSLITAGIPLRDLASGKARIVHVN